MAKRGLKQLKLSGDSLGSSVVRCYSGPCTANASASRGVLLLVGLTGARDFPLGVGAVSHHITFLPV